MKLGNEDYWQVGDKVYSFRTQRKTQIDKICLDYSYPVDTPECNYTLSGEYYKNNKIQTLFHIGAITFDEQNRPIAINYDYVPKREPKVAITKLPHEFKEYAEDECDCEIVLVKNKPNYVWEKRCFFEVIVRNNTHKEYKTLTYCDNDGLDGYWKYCIPYLGNEHCENKSTGCESGKIPDNYVFPQKEIFSEVKVGDILYRLYDGKYVKGEVVDIQDDYFSLQTDIITRLFEKGSDNFVWDYNFDGTITCYEEQGQVIFKETSEPEFKPFDKVLVRNCEKSIWRCDQFSHIRSDKGFTTFGDTYVYCIPYEGNEHLLGTTGNP